MADPFSIVAGTAGVLDICWRVGTYLAKVKAAAGKIERDLVALSFEVNSLIAVNESIRTLWQVNGEQTLEVLSPDSKRIEELWQDVKLSVFGCREVMVTLALLVEEVIGQGGIAVQGKRDGIKKVLRRQSRDDEIQEIRKNLNSHQNGLNLALSALNLYNNLPVRYADWRLTSSVATFGARKAPTIETSISYHVKSKIGASS